MSDAVLYSGMFGYDRQTKTFSAEISELSHFVGSEALFEMIVGSGLKIKSERTTCVSEFQLVHVEKDSEQDIVSWTFVPTKGSVHSYPALKNHTVVIYND